MTTDRTPESGSTTETLIEELVDLMKVIENLPPYRRAKIAACLANVNVLALRDLDRRILQLEDAAGDEQQDDRIG